MNTLILLVVAGFVRSEKNHGDVRTIAESLVTYLTLVVVGLVGVVNAFFVLTKPLVAAESSQTDLTLRTIRLVESRQFAKCVRHRLLCEREKSQTLFVVLLPWCSLLAAVWSGIGVWVYRRRTAALVLAEGGLRRQVEVREADAVTALLVGRGRRQH